jgi:hypothetical protein
MLSADQQAALRADVKARVQSDPALAAAYANRELDMLAALLSEGRTRFNGATIGNGIILDVLGMEKGTAVLDMIHATPAYKYVITLLDQGRAEPRTTAFQDALAALVAGQAITQDEASKLLATAQEPDPVTRMDVKDALFDDAGNEVQE